MKRAVQDFKPDRPAIPELAAGAAVVHHPSGELLLLHHAEEDRWCFPKGHVEPGESIRSAALREVLEETGLKEVGLEEELAEVSYRFYDPRKGVNVLKTTVYWLAKTSQRDARPEPTFDAHRWVDPRAATALLSYDTDRLVVDRMEHRPRPPAGSNRSASG